MIIIFVLLLFLMITIYNRERFRNFMRVKEPEIESRSNKHSFKRISNALGSLANIKSYKYVVGGNRGGSWRTMGFKEDEVFNSLGKYPFKKGGAVSINDDVVSNEKMVPYLVAAINQLYGLFMDNMKRFSKIQDDTSKMQIDSDAIKACLLRLDKCPKIGNDL